jgi:hypothetical protein
MPAPSSRHQLVVGRILRLLLELADRGAVGGGAFLIGPLPVDRPPGPELQHAQEEAAEQ